MPSLSGVINAPEYLNKIAVELQEPGQRLPETKDLPRKVREIIRILEDIEGKFPRPSNLGRLRRSKLPETIDGVLANHDIVRNVVDDVKNEIGRTTSTRIPLERLVSRTRAIIDALEDIEQHLCPKDLTKSAPVKIEELPSMVAELVNNQAFQREKERLSSEINRLRSSLQEQHQRNEELKREANNSNLLLKNAIEQAENALSSLKREHKVEVDNFKTIQRDLRDSHTYAMIRLRTEGSSAITEIEQRQAQEIKELVAQHEKNLDKHQNFWSQRVSTVEQDSADHKAAFTKKISKIQAQLAEELALHKESETQHQHEKAGLEDQIRNLNLAHDAEIKEQRENAKRAKEHWSQKLTEEVQQHALSQERARNNAEVYESQLTTLENQYNSKSSEQEQLHADALGKADGKRLEQLASMKENHESQLESERKRNTETEQRYELKLDENARTHQIAIEKMEKRCQKLQELILKDDSYSGLTDLEILHGGKYSIVGFTNIVSRVTTFSEWEWREDRMVWPKDAMESLAGTKQRRLKKLVLGDAIWRLLFQLIFCSPFRILGEEGKNLEEDWNRLFPLDEEESSDDYRWPTPTFICEKYRWETCEAALDSLTKPSSPYGPLRSSFIKNQAQFNESFLETVEAYVELTEKREQDLLKFLTDAVRMWLVFCTQRYRIRMIIPGSSESDPEKKMKLALELNDLKFTVAPRLQRQGNAKGAQLLEVSVISGCDGKVATVQESQS